MVNIGSKQYALSRIIRLVAIFSIFMPLHVMGQQSSIVLSDDKIKVLLIQESVSAYPGNCPCPYYTDRAGRQCGKRSAWSKPGGYSPLCYPSDVTSQMLENYRNRKRLD
jgi:hypothetical protein